MIAGDTCQTINPGSAFSFQDIVSAFHKMDRKPLKETPSDGWEKEFHEEALQSSQMSLGFNHRSSPQIVRLANTVSDLLIRLFPASVDSVEETACGSTGKPPVFVSSFDSLGVIMGTGALELRILDSTRCAVLVRTDACRNELRGRGVRGTILTIAESKGLEFDFVIIYNFFSACRLRKPQRLWRAVNLDEVWNGSFDRRSFHSAATAAALIPELKHLYVGITRARFGCAFVETTEQVWQTLIEYWANAGFLALVTSAGEYCKMAKAASGGSDSLQADLIPQNAKQEEHRAAKTPEAVTFTSVDGELEWIWSELRLRVGSQHKKARKMLGDERMRLHATKAFDPLFAFKMEGAHGPNLSTRNTEVGSQRLEVKHADLPPIIEVLRLRSDYHTGSSSLSSAIQQLKDRGHRLFKHALDDPEQRWPVFEEARAIFEEALRCSSKLLEEQLRNKGRFSLEEFHGKNEKMKASQDVSARPNERPDLARTIVQLTMNFRANALQLKDDMFHDVVHAEDAFGHEMFLVNATLLSGRELPEFSIAASATVDNLHEQLERTIGSRCRLFLKGYDDLLDVSAFEGSLSLREALAKTIQNFTEEIEWHRSICVILELQGLSKSLLSQLRLPHVWEEIFVMNSSNEASEARADFRLTVERYLEYERTRSSLEKEMQMSEAWFLRSQGQFSTFVNEKEKEAASNFSRLLETHKTTGPKILQERRIVTTKLAVRSLLASAQMLQTAQESSLNFISAATQRVQLWRQAANVFRQLGDIPNAAVDYERAASAGFQFLNRWKASTRHLGRPVTAAFEKIFREASSMAFLAAMGFMFSSPTKFDRRSLHKAEKNFLNAGCLREADALAVWTSPIEEILSERNERNGRKGLLLYASLLVHDLSGDEKLAKLRRDFACIVCLALLVIYLLFSLRILRDTLLYS